MSLPTASQPDHVAHLGYIDAHCHLSDPRVADLESVLRDCARAGIRRFVLGGVCPTDWQRQRELHARHPRTFYPAFGLHPWWIDDQIQLGNRAGLDNALRELDVALAENTPCALGETGLDAGRDRFKRSRDHQLEAFVTQLGLARKHRKPLVLHVVRAHELALSTLSKEASAGAAHQGIVHSFSGTWADAVRYLDLGLTLSISARVTFPDAADLHETVRKAPANRLVFETDAPDQPPHGAPGKLHSPLSLLKVVQKVTEIRGESPEAWLDRSRETLEHLFTPSITR